MINPMNCITRSSALSVHAWNDSNFINHLLHLQRNEMRYRMQTCQLCNITAVLCTAFKLRQRFRQKEIHPEQIDNWWLLRNVNWHAGFNKKNKIIIFPETCFLNLVERLPWRVENRKASKEGEPASHFLPFLHPVEWCSAKGRAKCQRANWIHILSSLLFLSQRNYHSYDFLLPHFCRHGSSPWHQEANAGHRKKIASQGLF